MKESSSNLWHIEAVSQNNLEEVLPLIMAYQEFYGITHISIENNRDFFAQFGPENLSGCQFAFRKRGSIVGFATVYFSYSSTSAARIAILNDLFTAPLARGQGVGQALIKHAWRYAFQHGAIRLQWLTAHDNHMAQRLYDSLETMSSSWRLYTYAPSLS